MKISKIKTEDGFSKGALWKNNNDGKYIVVFDKHDKSNVRMTNGRIISKRMLNKHYVLNGLVDLTKNTKVALSSGHYMHSMDCFIYETICKCGEKVGGWSPAELKELWSMHYCLK